MKDESGMTKDIEKVASELRNKYYEPFSMPKEDFARLFEQGVETNWVNVAKYVQQQVRIAEIKAKLHVIQDITRSDVENGFEELTSELQDQLAEAEKGEV